MFVGFELNFFLSKSPKNIEIILISIKEMKTLGPLCAETGISLKETMIAFGHGFTIRLIPGGGSHLLV